MTYYPLSFGRTIVISAPVLSAISATAQQQQPGLNVGTNFVHQRDCDAGKLSMSECAVITPRMKRVAGGAPSPAVRAACGPDARRLCADVIGNPGERRKCMRQHWAEVSDACKVAFGGKQP